MTVNGGWRMADGARLFAAALVFAVLAGCDYFTYTSVKDLTDRPGKFEGVEVKVKGTVVDAKELPLLGVKSYTLQDGDAKIAVIATGPLPAVNEKLRLKGTVKSTMIVNGKAVGQRVEESQRIK
jgi:hypothetical protein